MAPKNLIGHEGSHGYRIQDLLKVLESSKIGKQAHLEFDTHAGIGLESKFQFAIA